MYCINIYVALSFRAHIFQLGNNVVSVYGIFLLRKLTVLSFILQYSSTVEGPFGSECSLNSINITDTEPHMWEPWLPPRILIIKPYKAPRDWFSVQVFFNCTWTFRKWRWIYEIWFASAFHIEYHFIKLFRTERHYSCWSVLLTMCCHLSPISLYCLLRI